MCRDNDPKADTLDFNNDFFGVPRNVVAAEDLREIAARLSSFVVVFDDGSIT
jgi:hypothetical protein